MGALWKTNNYCWRPTDYIGKGTYGKVYKGYDLYTNDPVAVKVYNARKLSRSTKKYIEDVDRLSQLSCPYIVHYFAKEDVEFAPNKRAIIMEFADGNLQDELDKPENQLGLPKALFFTLMDHCVRALIALDTCQIAHRDLKPENILICRNGDRITFKLTDFGCSCSISSPDQPLNSIVGSGPYMPSSVIRGKAVGASVANYTKDQFDIWSVTCCFFKAATGQVPFQPDSDRDYFKAMNELLTWREPGTVCAHFDSETKRCIYHTVLPKQHSSYSCAIRENLCKFFQLMFSKEKNCLELEKFSQLCFCLIQLDQRQ